MILNTIDMLSVVTLIIRLVHKGEGWRAVPANQARYALRGPTYVQSEWGDEFLPRRYLHSTYKFGYCTPTTTVKQNIRRTLNLTFVSFQETDVKYIYLLASMKTQRFRNQCLVMKLYTCAKYLFFQSRLPLYYCQGQVYLIMLCTVQRIAIHEFFTQMNFRIPTTIVFTFYHPYIDIGYFSKVQHRGHIPEYIPKKHKYGR